MLLGRVCCTQFLAQFSLIFLEIRFLCIITSLSVASSTMNGGSMADDPDELDFGKTLATIADDHGP